MTDIEHKVLNAVGTNKYLPQVQTHQRQMLKMEAQLANDLLRIAMGMPTDVSRDPTKQALIPLIPPAEAVKRACEMSKCAFEEYTKRGWIVEMPSLAEMEAECKRHDESSPMWIGKKAG